MRWRWLCIALVGTIAAVCSEGWLSSRVEAQELAAPVQDNGKDPKLSSLLRRLRDAVPQKHVQPSDTSLVSMESLPKPIVEAVRARQMRITPNGEVQAYIEIDQITESVLRSIQGLGVKVQVIGDPQRTEPRNRVYTVVPTLQALVPMAMIQELENLSFVRYVALPDYAIPNTGSVDSQGDSILQADTVRSTTGGIHVDGTGISVGVISSGIGGIFATGCTACGPTANNPSPISLGDLPSATGTRNASGTLVSVSGGITAVRSYRSDMDLEDAIDGPGGAEGTGLLEIVHDLAPGTTLSFANADTTLEFEQAVDALSASNFVVVDDLSFGAPSFDGASSVSTNTATALNNNSNPIRAYITSAGNYALDHYEGLYTPSGTDGLPITGFPGNLHLFQGVPNDPLPVPGVTTDNGSFGPNFYDPVVSIPPNERVTVYLVWNDPVGTSNNDYDLFLVPLSCSGPQSGLPSPPCTISGAPLASSENPQTGTQNPVESISFLNGAASPVTLGIVIQNAKNMAAAVTFDLFIFGYGAKEGVSNHNFNTISGSIPAQSDAGGTPATVISVGAINQVQCPSPDNCTGLLERFSSQGPTQTTPQAPTPRIKPDLVAVDEVCITGAAGFGNTITSADLAAGVNCPVVAPTPYTPKLFGGTSAAAPHVAAVTALLLQAAPCLLNSSYNAGKGTPSSARVSIYNALTKGFAQSLPGYLEPVQNNQEGWGLVNALTSATGMLPLASAGANQTVSATSSGGSSVVLTGSGTDPNGCPLMAIQWSGDCGNGIASALHATVVCPIGVNTVRVGVSNNGSSFLPQSQVPYFTITVTDFMLSAAPTTATGPPGGSAIYTITVAPTAQGAFSSPVALSCSSGLPAGATCAFSPISVTPGAPGATSTLTIYTQGFGSSTRVMWPVFPHARLTSTEMIFASIVVAAFGLYSKRFRVRRAAGVVIGLVVFATLLGLSSCGSHTSTKPVTSTVTITGNSNQLSHTATVTLTVQ
jgi:hypothetical protein